ncbi:hypothetical protein Slin15195_G078070 [Septoria linicola]|uniref:G-protein coupled receptors family 2 profile 2 domain-containing protein n=1 Tax=Septoria linicola TaxID=215465 RepID=A0A9Q9AWJ5_9PEZI|nr:hypothetical protein Slin14017_G039260 [Septoria linicola]USW54488.1 hypothetical protein Slin15195_G078070 [Septoria linicola]
MANSTLLGDCVAPFLDASRFPTDGGFIDGRLCAQLVGARNAPTCCLPCPAAHYAYSDDFNTYGIVSEWLNVVGLILLCFMLVSYLVLPAQQTRSHYLSVCLIVSVMMIALGFTIPLGARPEQCYNEITPNDMYTSMPCAWGGACIIAGGLSVIMWVFIRALSMNLQICWDIVPGRKFFYISQMLGWGIPAVLFCITITLTGVSFRFGNACHVNHKDSMGDFWGPLMAIAGAAGVLQLMTLVYCAHVYLKNLLSDSTSDVSTNASATGLPSYQASVHTQTARAVFRRLKKVLWLQWRGICIVTIILVDVVFFTIVFVRLDSMQSSVLDNYEKVSPWLACLAANPTDKNQCLHFVSGWLVPEAAVAAVLLLLSLAGFQVFLLLTRPSIFPAWIEFFRSRATPNRQEFVSLDATSDIMRSNSKAGLVEYQRGHQNTAFEMQTKMPHVNTRDLDDKEFGESTLSSPESSYQRPLQRGQSPSIATTLVFSPPHQNRGQLPPEYIGRITPSPAGTPGDQLNNWSNAYQRPGFQREGSNDYFHSSRADPHAAGRISEERQYNQPASSFSKPRAPSRGSSTKSVSFDQREFYRGGLALNPPSEAGESREDVSRIP